MSSISMRNSTIAHQSLLDSLSACSHLLNHVRPMQVLRVSGFFPRFLAVIPTIQCNHQKNPSSSNNNALMRQKGCGENSNFSGIRKTSFHEEKPVTWKGQTAVTYLPPQAA